VYSLVGCQLAKSGKYIRHEDHKFSVPGTEKNNFRQNPPCKTAPAFGGTWTENLGDLGRHRKAMEDEGFQDRGIGSQVTRQWYLKASDRPPKTGLLYHHLADLTRPNALQHVFDNHKAVSNPQPFLAASESILSLFDLNLFSMSLTEHTQSLSAFTRRFGKRIKCITQVTFSNLSKLPSTDKLTEESSALKGKEKKVEDVVETIETMAGGRTCLPIEIG
jgi:hypothetical protein